MTTPTARTITRPAFDAASARVAPLVTSSRQRFPLLDGIRGVAIIAVMTLHFSPSVWYSVPEKALQRAFSMGWISVDLFFVLSGFLITGILADTRGTRGYFRDFYIRRAFRIFPVYYAFLAFAFILVPLVWSVPSAEYRAVAAQQGWYWAYGVNIAQVLYGHQETLGTIHLWSLSVEEQFYLVWPAIVWLCPQRAMLRVCLASIGIGLAVRIAIVIGTGNEWAAYVLTPARIDALALGGLIALLARSGEGTVLLRRLLKPLVAVAVATLLVHVAVTRQLRPTQPFVATIGLLCTSVVSAGILVHALMNTSGRLGRFLESGILRGIGRYSYGAYVLHMPLRLAVQPVANSIFATEFAARHG